MSVFGLEFEQVWPKAGELAEVSDYGKILMKQCEGIKKPRENDVDIYEFMVKSSNFPLEFGIDTCRVMSQPKERYSSIQKQITSAYPLIHERVLFLYLHFLEYKRQYGHPKEKKLYENLSLEQFIQRLLTKRCVSFVGPMDAYMLITGEEGSSGNFNTIGSDCEQKPLLLNDCLSYDEIKLSAFLSISSHSELINDGNRQNLGIIETDLSRIEREGVVIGLIGARFQRPFFMEYQDIVITPQQNIPENGYGQQDHKDDTNHGNSLWTYIKNRLFAKGNNDLVSRKEYRLLWQKFYQEQGFAYDQIQKDHQRFGDVVIPNSQAIFDNVVMKKRYAISFDTLLLEAQYRAAKLNKQAYVHVVGIGLGTWRIAEQQSKIFLETFSQRVKHLLPKLNNIGALHFSWFDIDQWGDLKHNGFIASDTHPLGGIRTFLANRNPADKLKEAEFENMLLVVSYAWDGNALPGNEFWFKHLSGSSDSSTASSTLITELHNPHINTEWVCASNLHIASIDYGITHVSDYAKSFSNML